MSLHDSDATTKARLRHQRRSWLVGVLVLWAGILGLTRVLSAGAAWRVAYYLLLGVVVTVFGGISYMSTRGAACALPIRRWRGHGPILVAAMLLTGCGCKAVLITGIRPGADVTIPVNGNTRLEFLQGGACGDGPQPIDMRFTSTDSTIAAVDSVSGNVWGKRVGDVAIWITYPGQSRSATAYASRVLVHVR